MDDTNNVTYQANMQSAQAAQASYEEFLEETRHPLRTNMDLLLEILRDNKDTEYGRKYGFADIQTYEDYKRCVPVIEFEAIDADVERMAAGESNVLTAYPFTHMNQTSGTVGKQKKVPMTSKLQGIFLKYNKHYNDAFYTKCFGDEWMRGRMFCTSQGASSELPSGITVGDASSVMAKYVQGGLEGLNAMMATLFTSPVEASIPAPGTDTAYLHTRFALADKDIRGIVSGYYVLIVKYLHYIAENYEMLIDDIESGTIDPTVEMPAEVRASVEGRLKPNPERAAELREIFKDGSDFQFVPVVWPHLMFFCAVGGAGFSVYADTVHRLYSGDAVVDLYSGITASEALLSVPVEIGSEDGCLVPGSCFMEFLPVEAGDDFTQTRTIDQLEVGRTYEVIITNVSGFYRYRLHDCVKVVSYFNETPRVRFMYRSNRVLDLACEKTTERAITLAAQASAQELGIPLSDYLVYGDREAVPPQYVVFIQPDTEVYDVSLDELGDHLEKNLSKFNAEYELVVNCRELKPCRALWLQPETTFLWRDVRVLEGASVNQLKPLRIVANDRQKEFFFGFVDERED